MTKIPLSIEMTYSRIIMLSFDAINKARTCWQYVKEYIITQQLQLRYCYRLEVCQVGKMSRIVVDWRKSTT